MFNNSLDRTWVIISKLCLMFQLRSSCFVFLANFRFTRSLPSPWDLPMSVWHVATMTFYFTRRLVVLPFHPQNVTRDSDAPCDEKLTKMSYLRLKVPTAPSQPMSFRIFRAHYASVWVYFQARLHTFCDGMPPAWCTLHPRGDRK